MWIVQLICCGYDLGRVERADWDDAEDVRVCWVADEDAGHERSAIISGPDADAGQLAA